MWVMPRLWHPSSVRRYSLSRSMVFSGMPLLMFAICRTVYSTPIVKSCPYSTRIQLRFVCVAFSSPLSKR